MFKIFAIFICVYIFLNSDICLAQDIPYDCMHTDTEFKCVRYIDCYDGDTCTVDIPNTHPYFGKDAHVRIYGINAPEITSKDLCEKKAAQRAKARVIELVSNAKQINLIDIGKEKFGRILAKIIADGQNVGSILLNEKLAYEYYGDTKKKIDWCIFSKTKK